MATFTMTLQEVLEHTTDIGLDHYPIFDESYRATLNNKIRDHYWNQEIGTETIQMFRLGVRRRMNEIMPYYNKLYKSELLDINPLLTVDITTQSDTSSNAAVTSEAESVNSTGSKSRAVHSEFPQHLLAGNEDYATSADDAVSDSSVQSSADESSNTEAETRAESRTSGIQGSQSDMLTRYRETFLNIDLMVIDELSDCFMMIWNTNDSYAQPEGFLL